MIDKDSFVSRFAAIGATFTLNGMTIMEPENGIACGNGKYDFTVPLSADLQDGLAKAYQKVIDLLSIYSGENSDFTTIDNPPHSRASIGLWLDFEANPPRFLFESGRIFDSVDDAIDYAIKFEQRFIYDLSCGKLIEICPELVESN